MKVKIEQIKKSVRGSSSQYLVKNSAGAILGMLEKWPNGRYTRHPWKAFSGIGEAIKYVGAFFPEDGAKAAAIAAILRQPVMPKLEVRVVSVSSNTNSFGLTGIILMAHDGRAWEVGHSQSVDRWEKGQPKFMPVDPRGEPLFFDCEIPRPLPAAPAAVVAEVWAFRQGNL